MGLHFCCDFWMVGSELTCLDGEQEINIVHVHLMNLCVFQRTLLSLCQALAWYTN